MNELDPLPHPFREAFDSACHLACQAEAVHHLVKMLSGGESDRANLFGPLNGALLAIGPFGEEHRRTILAAEPNLAACVPGGVRLGSSTWTSAHRAALEMADQTLRLIREALSQGSGQPLPATSQVDALAVIDRYREVQRRLAIGTAGWPSSLVIAKQAGREAMLAALCEREGISPAEALERFQSWIAQPLPVAETPVEQPFHDAPPEGQATTPVPAGGTFCPVTCPAYEQAGVSGGGGPEGDAQAQLPVTASTVAGEAGPMPNEASLPVLNPAQTIARDFLLKKSRRKKRVTGKQIVAHLRTKGIHITESTFRRHHLPVLRDACGVKNDRDKAGYYIP